MTQAWFKTPKLDQTQLIHVLPLELKLQNKSSYNDQEVTQFWCPGVQIVVLKSLLSRPYHLFQIPLSLYV